VVRNVRSLPFSRPALLDRLCAGILGFDLRFVGSVHSIMVATTVATRSYVAGLMANAESSDSFPAPVREFTTTHWSVVLAARDTASPHADAALAELCRTYWYPLYAFVRRRGNSPHDAQDLTQGFFARLLKKNFVAQADRERGRFRTYLLAALGHFLADG